MATLRKTLLPLAALATLAGCAEPPIIQAVHANNVSKINELVAAGLDPSASPYWGAKVPPVYVAACQNHLESVEALLKAGAAPDSAAVDCAVRHHNLKVLELLMASGGTPRPDYRDRFEAMRRTIEMQRADRIRSQPAPAPTISPAEKDSDVDRPSYRLAEHADDYAVVMGVEKYPGGLPAAEYAERDAKAVRAHLVALGFPERNIFLLTGEQASRAGLAKNLDSRLPKLVDANSTVFFYYSGHGAPDPRTGKAYLLPFDGDPAFLEDTAYPVSRLYERLERLPAKRVVVALDSCFSGAGGRSVLAKGVRPLVTKVDLGLDASGKVSALTASQGDQISGVDEDQGHGLFTYNLLKGLNEGKRSTKALYEYLKPRVEDEARRENRDQTPMLLGADAPL